MGYMVNSANPRLVLYDLQLNKRKRKFWPAKLKLYHVQGGKNSRDGEHCTFSLGNNTTGFPSR